jgi:hypothetical protein
MGKLFTNLYLIAIVVVAGTIIIAHVSAYSLSSNALADYCSCPYSSLFFLESVAPWGIFPYSLLYLGYIYTIIYWGLALYLVVHTLRWLI